MTTVDVIIPYDKTHTPEHMLERAIKSVHNQTVQTNIIKSEVDGVVAARNDGLSRSSNDYVAFLDADDYWEPEKLEWQLEQLTRTDASVCLNSTIKRDGVNNITFDTREELITKVFLGEVNSFTSGMLIDTTRTSAEFRSLQRREDHMYLIDVANKPTLVEKPYTHVCKHECGLSATVDLETRLQADKDFFTKAVSVEPWLRKFTDEYWARCYYYYGRIQCQNGNYRSSLHQFQKSLHEKVQMKTLAASGISAAYWMIEQLKRQY